MVREQKTPARGGEVAASLSLLIYLGKENALA